jgi:hypothetical protein
MSNHRPRLVQNSVGSSSRTLYSLIPLPCILPTRLFRSINKQPAYIMVNLQAQPICTRLLYFPHFHHNRILNLGLKDGNTSSISSRAAAIVNPSLRTYADGGIVVCRVGTAMVE